MKRILTLSAMVLFLSLASMASAATFTMFENFQNRDGTNTWLVDPLGNPSSVHDFSAVTWTTSFTTAGTHNFGFFVDPEIDQTLNTFYNEYGKVSNTPDPDSRLSWQIGDPLDTIWLYTQNNALSNDNSVPSGDNDVSMALMWNFNLAYLQRATLSFTLSDALPTSGFYLEQYDPGSDVHLYFSSTLLIEDTGGPNPVPEPSTLVLLGSALAGFSIYMKRRQNA